MRQSPVFVGQASFYEDIVHYIAPHYSQLAELLNGLNQFELLTRGAEALIRAAVLAFGFVYIHPMRDGNGRLHRFLINDTLIRDGAIPDNMILPISATIVAQWIFVWVTIEHWTFSLSHSCSAMRIITVLVM